MEAKEVFEKIREVRTLEVALKDVKPEFGNPDFIRYNNLVRELDEYSNSFDLKKLFRLFDQAKNEELFAVQYNLLMQSDS